MCDMNDLPGEVDRSIAAIIINYNGGEQILECLRSLDKQTLQPSCVVVVDNDSSDGSVAQIHSQFPEVRMIENGYNAGWGVGCNVGIEATSSRYIALINNDAYLDERCLEEMADAIELDPQYGACASKILLWDEPEKIEVAGLVIYPDGTGVGRGRLQSSELYAEREEVFCANDCCCLYRREMIDHIGLYDPDFFIYCDETDMGYRHQLAGWRCVYAPGALAYHAHSRSAGDYSDFKAYHVERNRIYLCIKYYPWTYLLASGFRAAYRYLMQVWLSCHGGGALAKYRESKSIWRGLGILIKAHWHALGKFPVMWRRRREFCKIRCRSNREFAGLFKRFGITARQAASYE